MTTKEEISKRMETFAEENLARRFGQLKGYAEGEPSDFDNSEGLIADTRHAILRAQAKGIDTSEQVSQLEDLVAKAEERDKAKK